MNKAAVAAIAAVVGLGAASAGAFAWTGGTVLEQLHAQTAEIGKISPAFKVVDEKIDRGLFRSTYDVTIRFGCMPALPEDGDISQPIKAGEPLELGLRTEIRHGPLLGNGTGMAALETVVVVPEKWHARVEKLVGKEPPLRVGTKLGFDRTFTSDITFASLQFQDQKAGSLTTDPVRMHVTGPIRDKSQPGHYTLEMPGFGFRTRTPDATLDAQVGRMHSETDVDGNKDPALWLVGSSARGTLDKIEIAASAQSTPSGPKAFKLGLDQVKFSSTTKISDGLWNSAIDYTGQGRFNEFKVDKVEIKGGLRRWHAASYQQLLSEVVSNAFSCEPGARAIDALLDGLQKQTASLLTHDPEYALDSLAVELGGQRGELSWSLGTHGIKPSDGDRALLDLLIEHGVVRAHTKVQLGLLDVIDRQLVASDPQLAAAMQPGGPGPLRSAAGFFLDQFSAAGYLVQTGDTIESSFSYEEGKLSLNGKTPQLPDLGSLIGGVPGAP